MLLFLRIMEKTIISIFKSVKEPNSPYQRPISAFLNRIKNGSDATQLVLKYRETNDNHFKQLLPCATISGSFSHRKTDSIISYSQFACLDFDKFESLTDVNQIKDNLISDPCLFACFISPSGKGVKAIFRTVNEPKRYKALYRALCNKYKDVHLDSKTCDISRACYESYDPDIFINNNAKEWNEFIEDDYNGIGIEPYKAIVPLKSDAQIIDNIQKWFDKSYSMVKGDRNNNTFIFASALNAYGINDFVAINYLSKYASSDFSTKEIEQAVKSAYRSHKNEFNTKIFEDHDTRVRITKMISSGKSKDDIKKDLQKNNSPIINDFDDIIENIKTVEHIETFWQINDKGKITIVPNLFEKYLCSNNFMKFYPEIGGETFIFVKKDKTLIEETNRDKIKDFVLTDLKNREDIGMMPYDYMALNTKFFSNEFLNILSTVDIDLKKDDNETCFLYYKNCVVEVKKDSIKEIDYIDINSYVWKNSVIDRDFSKSDHHKSVFRSFIWFISGQDRETYNCFKSAIGYLLHTYKTQADNKAIILNDELISDEPNGRSGKGLFFNGIKQLKKLVALNGKKIDLNSQFAFQTVKADCQVLVFDDVKRNFPFEDLFSIITEGLEIEYKGQGAIKLPVQKSPKIVITTNYTIKGDGGSFDARKHELELSSYFNATHSPRDEFGHMFFDDWDRAEWSRFDNYMIQCVQYYLSHGLQAQKHKNLDERKYITETSREFTEWTNDGALQVNTRHNNNEVFERFKREYPDFNNPHFKINTFKKWIKKYCEKHKFEYRDGNSNGTRYFEIIDIESDIFSKKEDTPF